jgi:hypothetical protein|tara:strand:+ start:839 stop:1075 length:237 start_codon:yes stop_codon:yes gene_type:complete
MTNNIVTKNSLPWKAGKNEVNYFVEVGTTPYGKYGLYKEMIPVGTGSRGAHKAIAAEIRLSNPELFEDLNLRQVVSRG